MDITILTKLGALADRQYGQITRQQAATVGVRIDDLVDSGFAEPILGDVFRLRAGGRSRNPRLYAAWLQLVPESPAAERSPPADGVVSHGAALRLYRVAGEPGPMAEFTIPETFVTGADLGRDIRLHIGNLGSDEWIRLAGLPVTAPGRTLIDLAPRYDVDELAEMAASMVSQQWISGSDLRLALTLGLERTPRPEDSAQLIDAILAEVRPS